MNWLAWILSFFGPKPAPTPAPAPTPPPPPTPAAAVFDDFNGPAGTLPSWLAFERGVPSNGQLQGNSNYPRNAAQDGRGDLIITAIKEHVTDSGYTVDYTSAALKSQGRLERKYGHWSARMNIPKNPGIYAALFLFGANYDSQKRNWPDCGEIDIFESVDNTYGSAIHGTGLDAAAPALFDPRGTFHEYWLDWRPQKITIGIDQTTTAIWTPQNFNARWPFDDQAMFIYLTLAVTKSIAAATVFPTSMILDWLKWAP